MNYDKQLYPLTHPQKQIWNTENFYPNTSISNVAGTLRIKENVDYNILNEAINLFIKNNDGMRLHVLEKDGQPLQYISKYEERQFDFFDFSDAEIQDFFKWEEEQTKIPFEIIDSDLFYFAIVQINDNDGGFYVKTHHLISDAWTMSIIGNKIVEYYSMLNNKEQVDDIRPSYIDYVINEQNYKDSKRFQKDREYWHSMFETMPAMTTLKTRSSNKINIKTRRKTLVTPVKFTNKLRSYCEENKISPYPLFLSALAMYINRVSSKKDIVLGTPILNRSNKKEKNTIGMFISTAPLRISIDENMDFKTFSQNISKQSMSLLRHQKYPYDLLLKEIRQKHKITDNLYDIVLSYQNSKFNKDQSEKFQTRWHFNEHQINSFTMHINDREEEGRLIIDYDFHSNLFYVKEIEFIHSHIISLLWHALDNPMKQIKNIEILTEREKHKILYEFNNTKADYPKDKTIHQLFEEQVDKSPENIALIFEDKKMTYRELNERANSLARILRDKGVKQDHPVGIMVYRSFEMIIGILAILKAGGAYLPIDPDYPEERINYMLENSNTQILLTQRDMFDKVKYDGEIIDIFDYKNYSKNTDNLKNENSSNHLAYVIYTSGSTGKPKGVMIEHHSVINRINWMQKKYPLDENSVILQKTPFTFDVSVWELLWWSFVGAKACILKPEGHKYPETIINAIERHKVTTMHFVPSMLNIFLQYLETNIDIKRLSSLKQVFASGEALSLVQVNKFNELLNFVSNTELYNLYGPTEATVDVSYFDCSPKVNLNTVPIGKPIDNTKLYILDKNNNLLPVGIAGELCIGGVGVARGYLNKPELTKEKFISNPFESGERIYKTGDFARWFSEGDIEYLGRIDNQVKIRGNRIELGEIQYRLSKHDSVNEVVVTVKDNNQGSKYICSYLVLNRNVTCTELKNYLLQYLPSYMVPSYFVKLNNIPLSNNGKANIKMLPDPMNICMKDENYLPPQNEIEEFVLSIWEEILEIKNIGIKDNFFDLGGDSLTAIKIISKFDNNISLEDLYRYPTIETFSKKVIEAQNYDDEILIKIGNNSKQENISVLCFPYGGGNAIIFKNISESLAKLSPNYSVYSINVSKSSSKFLPISETAIQVVDDIKKKIKGKIILYGHCVGSALTIEVAKLLQRENIKILGICLGGVFPPKFIKYFGKSFDPWKYASDKFIIRFLNKIGLPEMNLNNKEQQIIMDAFRQDVRNYYSYFYNYFLQKNEKLAASIYSIIGEKDPLTKNYENKYKKWCHFSENVKLCTIKDASHYFIKSHSDEVANIICSIK